MPGGREKEGPEEPPKTGFNYAQIQFIFRATGLSQVLNLISSKIINSCCKKPLVK